MVKISPLARRIAQRDAGHRASDATTSKGEILSTKGRFCLWRGVVAVILWFWAPPRRPRLASPQVKSVKCRSIQCFEYNSHVQCFEYNSPKNGILSIVRKKRGRSRSRRPKSREETPKEGIRDKTMSYRNAIFTHCVAPCQVYPRLKSPKSQPNCLNKN